MCVHVQPHVTQIAMLEGRTLVEHYVARAADDTTQIDGNIYRGRVQNVLPGMEAAFVDIGIPKNAVLYRGDVRYDRDDVEGGGQGQGSQPRIEDVLRPGQTHPVPGDQEPDRGQGGPPDPGGLPARAASPSWSPTRAPSASPSGWATTSAGACGGSSTRCGRPATA